MPKVFVEPRPPHCPDAIAGLQHRTQLRAHPATDQTEMAAMLARHDLDDGIRLPVAARAQHDAFVGPFHGFES